jgi:hypothetical protein
MQFGDTPELNSALRLPAVRVTERLAEGHPLPRFARSNQNSF